MKAIFTTLFLTILTLVAFGSTTLAAPVGIRDVYVPPVLYPHAGVTWKVGAKHNVTWDTSNPPKQITNKVGKIYLAKDGILDIDHPLAEGFDILLGRKEVVVPKVATGSDYTVVLFGDSGNDSGKFTITK